MKDDTEFSGIRYGYHYWPQPPGEQCQPFDAATEIGLLKKELQELKSRLELLESAKAQE